jgi:hypothetical protein
VLLFLSCVSGLGLTRLYTRFGLCVSKATGAVSGGDIFAASIACLTSSLSVTADLSLGSSLSVLLFARLGSSEIGCNAIRLKSVIMI